MTQIRRVFDALAALARDQAGVVSRHQALARGHSDEWLAAQVKAGRWRRVLPGVYAATSGPLSRLGVLWAVVLRMGRDAVLSHDTAAELAGLSEPSTTIHVTVPADRQPVRIQDVVVHRSTRIALARHPVRTPPQTSIEETVIDLTQTAGSVDDAASWLAKSVGARLTTPDRLAKALARRTRLRWRKPLSAALRDVAAGCHSMLELLYLRDVERAHALPRGERQAHRNSAGQSQYDDVLYRRYGTVDELDGRIVHSDCFRDMSRDNATVIDGRSPLRCRMHDLVILSAL